MIKLAAITTILYVILILSSIIYGVIDKPPAPVKVHEDWRYVNPAQANVQSNYKDYPWAKHQVNLYCRKLGIGDYYK